LFQRENPDYLKTVQIIALLASLRGMHWDFSWSLIHKNLIRIQDVRCEI